MDADTKKKLEGAVSAALASAVERGEAGQAAMYARVLADVAALPVDGTLQPASIQGPPVPPEVAVCYRKRAEEDAKSMGLNSVARGETAAFHEKMAAKAKEAERVDPKFETADESCGAYAGECKPNITRALRSVVAAFIAQTGTRDDVLLEVSADHYRALERELYGQCRPTIRMVDYISSSEVTIQTGCGPVVVKRREPK